MEPCKKIEFLLRLFLDESVKRSGVQVVFQGRPVDVMELAAVDGYLPLLFAQAMETLWVVEGKDAPWLKNFSLINDEESLLGVRLLCSGKPSMGIFSVLAFVYESLIMAKELSPEGVIELDNINPPQAYPNYDKSMTEAVRNANAEPELAVSKP